MSLDRETAVITGSSSGIGRQIALTFAKEGANIVTNAPTDEEAESTAAEISEEGGNALAVGADVTDRDAVERLIEQTVDEFGQLDVMVNNAGITTLAPVLDLSPDEWQDVIDVNLTGVFFGAPAAGRWYARNNTGGQIINISSIFGSVGVQGRAAHNASKGG